MKAMQFLPEVKDLYTCYFPSSLSSQLVSTFSQIKELCPLLFRVLQHNPSLMLYIYMLFIKFIVIQQQQVVIPFQYL